MADKASRALVIYADGFVPLISTSHAHLHSLASRSSCGFLSLRDFSCTGEDERVITELAQLLDAYDAYVSRKEECGDVNANLGLQTLSERFMGLRAAMFTTCPSVKNFGGNLGFNVLNYDQLGDSNSSYDESLELPDALCAASRLLRILGFSEGKVLENSEYDLVFVHIKAGKNVKDQLAWLNALVGGIIQIAQPGSDVASRLHLSVVMSYGAFLESGNECSLPNITKNKTSNLSCLFPRQSYTMKEGALLNNIRLDHPMLVAQWQDAVTRVDSVETFSFKHFEEQAGNLTILADRFLHEVAFKIWKAPKYGA